MKIGIVAWSLFENRGGIERNACNLAKDMLHRGHGVTIFYKKPSKPSAHSVYPIPEGAALTPLDLETSSSSFAKSKLLFSQCNLDVLIAIFSWESLLWFPGLLKDTGIPLVISERNSPKLINSKWNAYERACCLNCADSIHILLNSFQKEYAPELQGRITVIPNPAFFPENPHTESVHQKEYTILGAGRFVDDVKQFSLLIKAFALLADEFPQWKLKLCGDGPSYKEYKTRIDQLGLQDRTTFTGMVEDMQPQYASADIFCIPSKVEGFGMVTVEAQSHALPVVGFAECPGTNEIIVHNENGYLAENMTAECLAHYLQKLMQDGALRKRLGKSGKQMLNRYAPQLVYDAWENMLKNAAALRGNTRIQRLTNGSCEEDLDIASRELLNRAHPFDRSYYLKLHSQLSTRGKASPFSGKEIKSFLAKHKKFKLHHNKLDSLLKAFTSLFSGKTQ